MNLNTYKGLYDTDKFVLGYVDKFYNDLFAPIKDKVESVLEIGIQYGASVLLWKEYFTNAHIYGVDIDKLVDFTGQERITAYYGDAYQKYFVNSFNDEQFDIVIDDGPHTYESMVFFLENYLRKVKPGGYLILEDIIDTSWTPKLVELIDKSLASAVHIHDMSGHQQTAELLARWAPGLDVIVVKRNY